jgi:hypothetical protein
VALKITKKPAKTSKRTATAKARRPTSTKTEGAPEAGRCDHVPIADLDVVLLQVKANGRVDERNVVFNVFESESERWRDGAAWLAFHKSDMPHHAGLSTWIGIAKSVPLAVIDMIQAVLQAAGMEVERDIGRATHLELNPFARLSADGLEILVPAALVGDPNARRVIYRGGVKAIARGYTVAPSKAAALNELFFGK